MNPLARVLFICLLCCSAHSEQMIAVGATENTDGKAVFWEWLVPAARFAKTANAWDPEAQKLSADLSQYFVIARSNIMVLHAWKSIPELARIQIRQVTASVHPDDASVPPVRRAVVSFYFRESGSALMLPDRIVMMLLDGKVATPKKRSR